MIIELEKHIIETNHIAFVHKFFEKKEVRLTNENQPAPELSFIEIYFTGVSIYTAIYGAEAKQFLEKYRRLQPPLSIVS